MMEQINEMAKVVAENKVLKDYMKMFNAKNIAHEQCESEFLKANVSLKTDCMLMQGKIAELEQSNTEKSSKIELLEKQNKELSEKVNALEKEKSNVVDLKEKEVAC